MVPSLPIVICGPTLGGGGGGGGGGGVEPWQRRDYRNFDTTKANNPVAVDDCMSLILWTRYFLEAQGYGVDDVIIYQDNKSAIILEQNGCATST